MNDERKIELAVLQTWFRDRPADGIAGTDCFDAERILDVVLGKRPASERRALADHAAGCAECAAAWRLAREYAKEARLSSAPARTLPWRWIGAAAALLVLALAAPLVMQRLSPGGAPALRSVGHEAIESLTPSDRPLPADAFELRWSAGPEGTRYDLRVMETDLEKIAGARALQAAEYTVPAEALAGIEPGTTLLWQVDATFPDGRRISSETFAVRLE